MLRFDSDYMETAHPAILARLTEMNYQKTTGYGLDEISVGAKEKIRAACQQSEADVYFLVGGTQTNATVIRTILGPCQGVIAADTGHIAGHEAGAIESTGHKVLTIPHDNGKLQADLVETYLKNYFADENHSHVVEPGMVYISHPTEYGTLYTKKELEALRAVCDAYNLPLFLDGARLAYGLAAQNTDVALADIAELCDVFYIGGTKCGAMLGEAIVAKAGVLPTNFFSIVKNVGALLAKGWLLGVQFDVLFSENRYLEGGKNAIELAMRIRDGLKAKGYEIYIDSPTNQQFVVIDNAKMESLRQHVTFGFWEVLPENRSVIRFATSWATTEEDVEALLNLL